MRASAARQEALPSHEILLADYVERLARHLPGRRALHVHLSKLQPQNRRDHHIRIALNSFEPLVKRFDGQLFLLGSSDIVVVLKGATADELDEAVVRLRYFFSDDPLAAQEPEGESGDTPFCTRFDLATDYGALKRLSERVLRLADERKKQHRGSRNRAIGLSEEDAPRQPITPGRLGRLEESLAAMDISTLLRRQPICAIMPGAAPKLVFNELYVSIPDLRRRVMPDVDLVADKWLFQRLTLMLDQRLLATLPALEQGIATAVSVNVNIATLLSPQFLAFDNRFRAMTQKTVVFELQPADLFSDIASFMFVRDFLRERGYRVCLDGMNHLSFPLIRRDKLGVDLEKILWIADIDQDAQESRRQRFERAVREAGAARVILCHCDSPRAIEFGQSLGVTMFQGRYVDRLVTGSVGAEQGGKPVA